MPTLVRDRAKASKRAPRGPRAQGRDPGRGRLRRNRGATRSDEIEPGARVDDTGRRRIDPRMRARREAVIEGRRRRRRRITVVVLVVATLAAAGYLAVQSSLLAVRSLDVEGALHTSPDSIRSALGVSTGQHMLDVDEPAAAERVKALPWVETATVERRWPGTVQVAVTERTIKAVVPDGAGGWLLVDGTGRVLGPTEPISHQFVPHILGLPPAGIGKQMNPNIAGPLAVASKLTVSLGGRIASLSVSPEGTVDAKLQPRGTAWLGRPDDRLDDKMRALQTVLAQVDLHDLCRLDLRVPSNPVLTRDPQCA